MLPSFIVVLLGLLGTLFMQRGRPGSETRLVLMAFVAHIIAAVAQVVITVHWYGGGDMTAYAWHAARLERVLDYDLLLGVWGLLRVVAHQHGELPVTVFSEGTATGSMIAASTLILYAVGGSLTAACLLLSELALLSRVLILRTYLFHFEREHHRAVALVVLFLPSVTFWGAGLAKETIALIGLGPLVWGANRFISRETEGRASASGALVAMFFGGAMIWFVKPYVLIAFILAAAVWVYTARAKGATFRFSPIHAVGAIVAGSVAVWAVGAIFPRYALDAVAEQAATLQASGSRVRGGSSYTLGNSGEMSFAGQVGFAPVALVFALFRPFLFEARNVLMFATSLETTWLTLLVGRTAFRVGVRGTLDIVQRHPILAFSLVYVLVLGVGVGIATSNAGTLTRYRTPS